MYWYLMLTVQIRWNGNLSKCIKISKGTRQGGLSSPFIFNIFYQDMIGKVSDMFNGVNIGSHTYNIFCYADDVLLLSLTASGLQKLIDNADTYVTCHGLSFNATKSVCAVYGKRKYYNTK